MTVSSTTRKAGPFAGNGSTTVFPFTFKLFATSDLRVILTDAAGDESDLVLDSDFSAALNADQDNNPGGTVTYSYGGIPLAANKTLTILSNVALVQPTDITNLGGFYPSVIESAMDRVVILAQQLQETLSRAIRFAVSDPASNAELPTAEERANKAIVFDDEGNITVGDAGWQVEVTHGNIIRQTHVKGVDFVAGGTTLSLTSDAFSKENVHILFDAAEQQMTEFSLSGATITLAEPIPSDVEQIETCYIQPLSVGSINDGVVTDDKVAANAGIDSAKLNFVQAGAGAVARTVRSKLRDVISVFDYMNAAQIADVQSRAFTLDVTAAIAAAMTYAASIRATVYVPAGLYMIVPATAFADEDATYTTYAAFLLQSHTYIEAEPGATFKVANGVSSDAAPKSMGVFCTNGVLTNFELRHLIVDMNGANNPISPLRPATYNRYNQSPILVSGTPAGVAARIDNVVIEHCTFMNNPGVCSIVMAQSNTVGVTLAANWKVNYNRFIDNGLDTDDHTGVFAWADDVQFVGNEFYNTLRFHEAGSTGGNTCYEIHGSRHRLVGNSFRNYYRGVWVSSNLTAAECRDSIIVGNAFTTAFYGVDFFRTTATLSQPRNTIIANNTFRFDDWTFAPPVPQQRSAIQVASEYAQADILITGNLAISTDSTVGAAFLTITPQTVAGQTHSNIVCKSNTARGFVNGVVMRTNATNGLGYVSVVDNEWIEPIPTPVFTVPIGEFIDPVSPIKTLVLNGNRVIDERAVPLAQYGTYIQGGTITDLYYDGCYSKGTVSATYIEAGTLLGNKHGTFENLPFTPVFRAGGTAFTVGDGAVLARYSIKGKDVRVRCTFDIGATTVIPAGLLSVDMPIVSGLSGLQFMGSWRIFDDDLTQYAYGWAQIDGSSSSCSLQVDGGTFATSALPVALADGDRISVDISYVRP